MIELTNILETATAAIEERYFRLKIDGGNPVYRERVYCYELYHQMRTQWSCTDFVLNGEVDKSAHPIMEPLGANGRKPDLLVHGPGDMNANFAIIEVKSCSADKRGIDKDLETLSFFRDECGYRRSIFLMYGFESSEAMSRTMNRITTKKRYSQIELWIHKTPGIPAQLLGTIDSGGAR